MFISSVIKYYNYIPIILNIDGKACDRSLATFLLWTGVARPEKETAALFGNFRAHFHYKEPTPHIRRVHVGSVAG